MNKPRKVQRVYEAGFKITVARDYLQSKLGYSRIANKYQLPRATVCSFVKWHKKTYPEQAVKNNLLLSIL